MHVKKNNQISMLLAEAVASSLARKMVIAGVVSHGLFFIFALGEEVTDG